MKKYKNRQKKYKVDIKSVVYKIYNSSNLSIKVDNNTNS